MAAFTVVLQATVVDNTGHESEIDLDIGVSAEDERGAARKVASAIEFVLYNRPDLLRAAMAYGDDE